MDEHLEDISPLLEENLRAVRNEQKDAKDKLTMRAKTYDLKQEQFD